MIGFLMGAGTAIGSTFMLSRALRRQEREALEAVGRDPACEVAIMLFGTDGTMVSMGIDATTGGLGFSHVCLRGCEVDDEGDALLIDCRPGRGVFRSRLAGYEGRVRSQVILTGAVAAEMYGCAKGRVGADFTPENNAEGLLCSQLVESCLPRDLASRVAGQQRYSGPGGLPSPNQIAAAFGVRPGQDVVVW